MAEIIEFSSLVKLRDELKQRDILVRQLLTENELLAAQVGDLTDRLNKAKLQMVEILAGYTSLTRTLTEVALNLQEITHHLNGK